MSQTSAAPMQGGTSFLDVLASGAKDIANDFIQDYRREKFFNPHEDTEAQDATGEDLPDSSDLADQTNAATFEQRQQRNTLLITGSLVAVGVLTLFLVFGNNSNG